MQVLGLDKLKKFWLHHTDAKHALEVWISEAKNATWTTPQDIKNRYHSADFLAGNLVILNIKGNKYRLVIKVRYKNGIVIIEWVGTHADYSKKRF